MLTVEIKTEAVTSALNRAAALGEDLSPVMARIAESLRAATDDAFDTQGNGRWPPLNPDYAAKVAGRGSMLNRAGGAGLRGSIQAGSDATSAWVGSNLPYAAIHQFGGRTAPHTIWGINGALSFMLGGERIFAKKVEHPGANIPARPYLPMSADGQLNPDAAEEILATIGRAFGAALEA